MDANDFTLEIADWTGHAAEIYAVRESVFIQEQGVPEALERDALDSCCRHVLARDREGRAIGTGRLLPDGHIGRVAVLRPWRGRGLGRAIMQRLIELAREEGFAEVELDAQTHALDFYERLGFRAEGDEFLEAGLPHRRMRLRLERPAAEPVEGAEACRRAAIELIGSAHRRLCVYTPYLEPRLFNDPEWLAALRAQVVERPRLQVRLLLPPAREWRRQCPLLVQLAERLPSAVALRTPPAAEQRQRPEFSEGLMIADETLLLQLADPRRSLGSLRRERSARTRKASSFFTECWDKSVSDSELRRLGG